MAIKIGLDASGGDFCPQIPVEAACLASLKGHHVVLFGKIDEIENELKKHQYDKSLIESIDCPESLLMTDSVRTALIGKKNSSMRVGFNKLSKGEIDAFISAGHSGAMMALGKSIIKTIAKIDRPCFTVLMPTKIQGKVTLLADAGANLDCEAEHLLQFGIMCSAYYSAVYGAEKPKIALMNIGTEEGKGNEVLREVYGMFQASDLNFIGNIEGKTVLDGEADVIITDGLTGNVIIKTLQGAVSFMKSIGKEYFMKSFFTKMGTLLMINTYRKVKKRIDYSNYGGAPILGLKKNAVICHGSSNTNAIYTAIKYAKWSVESNYIKDISQLLDTVEKS